MDQKNPSVRSTALQSSQPPPRMTPCVKPIAPFREGSQGKGASNDAELPATGAVSWKSLPLADSVHPQSLPQ